MPRPLLSHDLNYLTGELLDLLRPSHQLLARHTRVCADRGTQYRHGIYPHSDVQEETARAALAAVPTHPTLGEVASEVVPAATFWKAEDYHREAA